MMIDLGEQQQMNEDGLQYWQWALKIIKRYGHEGMSSDESDSAIQTPNKPDSVYRVKAMPWRRRIEDLLGIIDGVRHNDAGIFSLQGSTGIQRTRPNYDNLPERWPQTSRRVPKRLPFSFYHEPWFNEIDIKVRQANVQSTGEQIKWLKGFRA